MKEAIYSRSEARSYMYREILIKVWDYLVKKDRYKKYYSKISTLEQDINDLEPKFKEVLGVDFDIKFCEELYNEVSLHNFLKDLVSDIKKDLADIGEETGEREDNYDYPCKELAIPITGLEKYYLGFTYYFGGGKYDDGSWIPDITDTCYLLTARDEIKTIKVFERC